MSKHSNAHAADEEQALMRRIANGDEAAFEALYDRYAKLLYSIIFAVVRQPPEAEDVLQEVFLHIWNTAQRFDATRGNVYSWLVTMTRNRAIDKLRSKRSKAQQYEFFDETALLLHPDNTLQPLDAMIMIERSTRVRAALDSIPEEQREALMLAYFHGRSQSEIAALLNIPLGTIKTRMRQGLHKLYRLLTESE